ncbi:MAG: hypothetical protein ACYDG6_00845 [Thermincolia bacterium]
MYSNEFTNDWDIDVFKSLARASVRATAEASAKVAVKTSIKVQAWISYKDVYEKEKPCNSQIGFGMSMDNLVRLEYFSRKGSSYNLTDKGLKRYEELLGA